METIISAPIRASSSARHLNDIANLLSPFESVCAGDFLKPPPPVLREAVIISRLNVEQLEVSQVFHASMNFLLNSFGGVFRRTKFPEIVESAAVDFEFGFCPFFPEIAKANCPPIFRGAPRDPVKHDAELKIIDRGVRTMRG